MVNSMDTTQMRMSTSSSNPRKTIPSFFKIFLDDSATNLPLPLAFAKKQFLEGRFPKHPVLQTESGKQWGVKMVKIVEKYCFGKGWLEFVKDRKTEVGDFIVFWLIGKSTFQVSIYGPNGCEKDLSSATPTTCKCVCNRCRSKIAKSDLKETTKTVIKMDEEDDDEDEDGEDEDYEKEIEPQSFEKVLKKSHTYTMTLPKSFVQETGLERQEKTMLRNKEGKEWPVKIGRRDDGSFYLANGWFKFRKENKIIEGNTCSFRYSHGEGGRNGFFQFEFVKKVARKRGRSPLNRSHRP